MKKCKRCNSEKPESEFAPHKLAKDRLQSWCRECKRKRQADYRSGNPTRLIRLKRLAFRKIITRYKRMKGCLFCGERYPKCLDFHHLDPSTKKLQIANNADRDSIKAEIRKCIVVCSNCHRKLHDGLIRPPQA